MFGFEDEETTTQDRYDYRKATWMYKYENEVNLKRRRFGKTRHAFWWFVHNTLVHPLLGILPIKPMFQLHDWQYA